MRRIISVACLLYALLVVGCGKKDVDSDSSQVASLPAEAITENNRGVGLMGSFDYDGAWQVFHGLTDQYPGHPQLQVNLAIAQLNRQQEGDEQAALQILKRVLQTNPGHLNALYVTGLLETNLGDPTTSHERFRFVAEQDPEDAYAAYFTGQTLLQMDRAEEAIDWYGRAIAIDPYLRSASYGAAQAARRLGMNEEAAAYLKTFQSLAENPRARLAEIKYTRMGPKAEVLVLGESRGVPVRRPLWTDLESVFSSSALHAVDTPAITACDIDLDGRVDMFCNGLMKGDGPPSSRVFWNKADGWVTDETLPPAQVTNVNTALWGDVDANGWPDVYLCRDGGNQLWLQDNGVWKVGLAIEAAEGMPRRTVDGAIFDADHDGDLDIFAVNADGPNVLINNNRDGTWRSIGEDEGLPAPNRASRQVVVADLDNDRDLDLVIINEEPPHEVYVNDRLWRYKAAQGFEEFKATPMAAVAAGDINANGQIELVSLGVDNQSLEWSREADWLPRQVWSSYDDDITSTEIVGPIQQPRPQVALLDLSGTGRLMRVQSSGDGWLAQDINNEIISDIPGHVESHDFIDYELRTFAPVLLKPDQGYSIVTLHQGEAELVISAENPGPGRYPFVAVSFTGKHDEGQSMRSNASGIGTRYSARSGSRWSMGRVLRDDSGPGQSLQPVPIGLGPDPSLDFLAIEWSDGVYQTELGLSESTVIEETQRQLSSCPVLFVRDGDEQIFVSDLLGVGGIGFRTGRDTVVTPRPWERFLMPEGVLRSHDGHYELTIAEPMEESCYLDAARLVQWHLPPGWSMTLDERMGTAAPLPTGEPVFYRTALKPSRCRDNMSGEITAVLLEVDGVAVEPTDHDVRFMGRLVRPHQLELSFDKTLDSLPGSPVLVLDGWVEYPYSQTNFAAWQAGATYDPPTIEARGEDGVWEVVASKVGYPAGMPRQMSLPLGSLPDGVDALRITSNLEIYWDAAMVVGSEPCPDAVKQSLPLQSAHLFDAGYPERRNGPQKRPGFDWSKRVPLWDTRFQRGMHSLHGDVHPLIEKTDAALAIFGPGEAVECSFSAIPEPLNREPGWTSRFVLEIDGWCKDKDLFTQDGDTIEPLPVDPMGEAAMLHQNYNDRWMGGH
ncbi:MAG: FG-GAP-like repeat-containing protein [Planctomycetota bacterium]|nr:FG-GAP-like repeat-containing protein [Planctomycetota bacterium]